MPLESFLLTRMMIWIPLVLSLSVHEWAHAWTAWKLGDSTALRQDRLTLNPLAHVDPVGTFMLPLLGVPFGWARPVPIDPSRFRRGVSMNTGILLTAAAGPLSNLAIAGVCLIVTLFLNRADWFEGVAAQSLLTMFLVINVALALFNSLPIPPLDGSRVVDALMPDRFRPVWDQFCSFGPVLLCGTVCFLSLYSGWF